MASEQDVGECIGAVSLSCCKCELEVFEGGLVQFGYAVAIYPGVTRSSGENEIQSPIGN